MPALQHPRMVKIRGQDSAALDLAALDAQAGNVSGRWYSGGHADFITNDSPSKKFAERDIDIDSLMDYE